MGAERRAGRVRRLNAPIKCVYLRAPCTACTPPVCGLSELMRNKHTVGVFAVRTRTQGAVVLRAVVVECAGISFSPTPGTWIQIYVQFYVKLTR